MVGLKIYLNKLLIRRKIKFIRIQRKRISDIVIMELKCVLEIRTRRAKSQFKPKTVL